MKIIIVGGVAGGASAATRCRRLSEKSEIILYERGEYISFANCGLPYYFGGKIKNRKQLLRASPDFLFKRYNIKINILSEVTSIDRKSKKVTIKNLKTNYCFEESYDKLILSPGAFPIRPKIPGINSERIFALRNIPDIDAIDEAITYYKANNVIIIGGGFVGIEMAENCKQKGLTVSVVEMQDQVMNNLDVELAAIIHNHLRENEISLFLNNGVESFKHTESKISVILKDGKEIQADLVLLSLGIIPESKLALESGLETGIKKTIQVNKFMQTSDSNIYAVGDAVQVKEFINNEYCHIPLAGPAVRQARIAADHIFGRTSFYRGSQGTSICKIFELSASSTGLNEKSLKKTNIPYEKIYIYDPQHVDYYPGATPVLFKLIFNKDSGKILGAQAIGKDGVDKRIDIISMAIQGGMTVFDLEESELNYAPPYGAPKDIINMAGFAASNIIRGDIKQVHWDNLIHENNKEDSILLDIRTPKEFDFGNVKGSINIPLNELRQNINKLENYKEKIIFIYCYTGYRSYIGCRILTQLGFNVINISGGYSLYKFLYHV